MPIIWMFVIQVVQGHPGLCPSKQNDQIERQRNLSIGKERGDEPICKVYSQLIPKVSLFPVTSSPSQLGLQANLTLGLNNPNSNFDPCPNPNLTSGMSWHGTSWLWVELSATRRVCLGRRYWAGDSCVPTAGCSAGVSTAGSSWPVWRGPPLCHSDTEGSQDIYT